MIVTYRTDIGKDALTALAHRVGSKTFTRKDVRLLIDALLTATIEDAMTDSEMANDENHD